MELCKNRLGRTLPLVFLLFLYQFSFAQDKVPGKTDYHFSGSASITNNGISVIPTFSLGKPAAIFNLSVGNKRLSFEPEFRFALEGKPWSYLFWWRYKIVNHNKFKFNIGAHPAIAFRTITAEVNGVQTQVIQAQRFLAAELSPNYILTKNLSVGMYYLWGHGIDADATRNTHFLTINANFSSIKLPGQIALRFNPQVYYLKMDQYGGFYTSAGITVSKANLPVSISGFFNKVIKTDIKASQNFIWSLSLTYSFHHNYHRQ